MKDTTKTHAMLCNEYEELETARLETLSNDELIAEMSDWFGVDCSNAYRFELIDEYLWDVRGYNDSKSIEELEEMITNHDSNR